MATMIRKQIYLEPDQNTRLKQVADAAGIPEAELIRQALDQHLQAPRTARRNLAAWDAEKAFIEQRMAQAAPGDSPTWSRDDLHER